MTSTARQTATRNHPWSRTPAEYNTNITKDIRKYAKKSRIRETKNLLTNADSSTFLVCFSTAATKRACRKKKSRIRKTKHLSTDADSSTDAIGGWTKAKSAKKKKLRGDFRPLRNKNVQMLDPFFPLLFSKDSESLKILDIRLWEGGAKDR